MTTLNETANDIVDQTGKRKAEWTAVVAADFAAAPTTGADGINISDSTSFIVTGRAASAGHWHNFRVWVYIADGPGGWFRLGVINGIDSSGDAVIFENVGPYDRVAIELLAQSSGAADATVYVGRSILE